MGDLIVTFGVDALRCCITSTWVKQVDILFYFITFDFKAHHLYPHTHAADYAS